VTDTSCPPMADRITKSLLGYGVIAGPIYLLAAGGQMLCRQGYDPTRHAVSQLANGDFGWVQITNFILTGAMTVAGAVGLGRALRPGRSAPWASALVGLYGLGLIAAGVLRADPADGFPPGTSRAAGDATWHGLGHFAAAGVGFGCLVAAAFVIGGAFAGRGLRGWAWFSRSVAAFVGVSFVITATGSRGAFAMLLFSGAVVLAWAWLSAVSAKLYAMAGV
jgi:Protein of unknown function (DUF998)